MRRRKEKVECENRREISEFKRVESKPKIVVVSQERLKLQDKKIGGLKDFSNEKECCLRIPHPAYLKDFWKTSRIKIY